MVIGNSDIIREELMSARTLLDTFINDLTAHGAINLAAMYMLQAIRNGGKIISCGNGGSMCDAMHFSSELTGRYQKTRRPIKAVAISDVAHMTCVSNDFDYSQVFSRWIDAHGDPGDVLLAISTSGNSENVFAAVKAAHRKNILVVYLSGNNGGSINDLMTLDDIEINVPYFGHAARIQEMHIKIIHILVNLIEKGL